MDGNCRANGAARHSMRSFRPLPRLTYESPEPSNIAGLLPAHASDRSAVVSLICEQDPTPDMISTRKGGRGFSAAISRTKPGRLANSAPETPSSTEEARLGYRPALAGGVGGRVVDLPSDALGLVGDGTLTRTLRA